VMPVPRHYHIDPTRKTAATDLSSAARGKGHDGAINIVELARDRHVSGQAACLPRQACRF
jgi:hypothetical protein